MPRSNREYLLRFADQADNDLDRALEKIGRMKEKYAELHPDHAKFCELVMIQIAAPQAQLKEFRHTHM